MVYQLFTAVDCKYSTCVFFVLHLYMAYMNITMSCQGSLAYIEEVMFFTVELTTLLVLVKGVYDMRNTLKQVMLVPF